MRKTCRPADKRTFCMIEYEAFWRIYKWRALDNFSKGNFRSSLLTNCESSNILISIKLKPKHAFSFQQIYFKILYTFLKQHSSFRSLYSVARKFCFSCCSRVKFTQNLKYFERFLLIWILRFNFTGEVASRCRHMHILSLKLKTLFNVNDEFTGRRVVLV